VLLVGLKADKVRDAKALRSRIVRHIGQLFDCVPGDNLFLVSSVRVSECHDELKRLEEAIAVLGSGMKHAVGDSCGKDLVGYTLNLK
jgi:hypothetical protein